MLSVAHHPETPGSASKHSALHPHTWTMDKSSALKRRRTESDSIVDKKKPVNGVSNLSEQFNFISSEITLTLIPKSKSQNQIDTIHETKSKASFIDQDHVSESDKIKDEKDITPNVVSLMENYQEIQLTKLNSSQNVKSVFPDSIQTNHSAIIEDKLEKSEKKYIEQKSDFLTSNSGLNDLSEITIEPCSSSQKPKIQSPSTRSDDFKTKRVPRSQDRLAKAQEMLSKKTASSNNESTIPKNHEIALFKTNTKKDSDLVNEKFAVRSDTPAVKPNFNNYNQQESSPFFEDEPDNVPVPVPDSEFQGFNEVGVPCSRFYSKNKDKPYYAIGFPNQPMENRCWANATFQVLFALPPINNIHNFQDASKRSKLLSHLINIQTIWRTGSPRNYNYDNCFNLFKQELAVLDSGYATPEQQDVMEFIMLLLNTLKTELGSESTNESSKNEIENIPNNEQDSLPRTQNNSQDSNKRLPLTEISTVTRPLRNTHLVNYGTQDSSVKSSSCSMKSKSETEVNSNPIDDYFSFCIEECYTCEGCSKERQQDVDDLVMFIDLPSEDNGSIVNLSDLIKTSYAAENRDTKCESCNHEVQKMEPKFKKLPKILIAAIKRYQYTDDGTESKISTLIEIPKVLQLDSLIVDNPEIDHFPKYEPVGIISHVSDRPYFGHYVSCVKHNDQWYHYDDLTVKLLTPEEVFKCCQDNVYLIFFEDTEPSRSADDTNDQLNNK